ncbi:Armadillo-type fold [Phytophthora cinnamomi]|uniref:Armadillo-type fold n=1 Tax=Phytophthora cinnamomi TaxID=4785 RepID=UPI00355A31D9|nr:Armadillo-type fold [Phytophthora cinnamomi]
MQRLELLRASATDADAVRQYLQSIDADELDALLDGIAPRDAKCAASKGKARAKDQTAFLVQDDWLPLVQLLAQCDATRLRAACRIVQELRRGSPSELESMQLLTEVTLGYARALDELQERRDSSRGGSRRRLLLDEIRVLLDVVFSFLAEVVEAAKPTKVLPQLLGLVPYFLGLMGEITGEEADAGVQENLAKLLELPWSCQTVPSLLDVLVDDAALMSRESWQQLQENVERMVTTSPEMTSETMNPLPVHLRQEAEFNLLMSFQQSPRIVSLVRSSKRPQKHARKCSAAYLNDPKIPLKERSLEKLFHNYLFRNQEKLFPHINAVQDWLSMQFQRSFDSAHAFFLIASRLATVHKDLYNFLMTIDYRLVSSKKKKLYLPLKTSRLGDEIQGVCNPSQDGYIFPANSGDRAIMAQGEFAL